MSELSLRKKIDWTFHVDESTEQPQYDMIIGDDILQELGIDLNYSTKTIVWEQTEVPMKDKGTMDSANLMQSAIK